MDRSQHLSCVLTSLSMSTRAPAGKANESSAAKAKRLLLDPVLGRPTFERAAALRRQREAEGTFPKWDR